MGTAPCSTWREKTKLFKKTFYRKLQERNKTTHKWGERRFFKLHSAPFPTPNVGVDTGLKCFFYLLSPHSERPFWQAVPLLKFSLRLEGIPPSLLLSSGSWKCFSTSDPLPSPCSQLIVLWLSWVLPSLSSKISKK